MAVIRQKKIYLAIACRRSSPNVKKAKPLINAIIKPTHLAFMMSNLKKTTVGLARLVMYPMRRF